MRRFITSSQHSVSNKQTKIINQNTSSEPKSVELVSMARMLAVALASIEIDNIEREYDIHESANTLQPMLLGSHTSVDGHASSIDVHETHDLETYKVRSA